jgi:hypothetical protein
VTELFLFPDGEKHGASVTSAVPFVQHLALAILLEIQKIKDVFYDPCELEAKGKDFL